MCCPFDDDDDPVVVAPMVLALPSRVHAWLARHSADNLEAEEIIASMVTMIVDEDEAVHATCH